MMLGFMNDLLGKFRFTTAGNIRTYPVDYFSSRLVPFFHAGFVTPPMEDEPLVLEQQSTTGECGVVCLPSSLVAMAVGDQYDAPRI
jgi:hypothetical protein